jgi:hypothetical protein
VGLESKLNFAFVPVDLDAPEVLVQGGLYPSPTNYQFLMQMTYAVAMTTYEAFRKALGRNPHWGFEAGSPAKLKLFPFHEKMENAVYNREEKGVEFGWYDSEDAREGQAAEHNLEPRASRKGKVYTALSHDIIAHEVSHALLDGLRPNFLSPYHHDTLALHEGFSDLVAVFQHFSHRELLEQAIMGCKGNIARAGILTSLASQFGQTKEHRGNALRSVVDVAKCDEKGCALPHDPIRYKEGQPIHRQGSVLVSSVFDAFILLFNRKTKKYIDIATKGSGELPSGNLERSLAKALAKQAAELAGQLLSICIRAIDYCPPVAATFGDYLRAMITADYDLVPDDPYGYREALVDSFIRRDIPIEGVDTISESSLLWETQYDFVDKELIARIMSENEFGVLLIDPVRRYRRRAHNLGKYLISSGSLGNLGLISPNQQHPKFKSVSKPKIESARVSRRIGPDNRLETDLIVEVTQSVLINSMGSVFPAIQGCTVIIDSRGHLRYVIKKDAIETVEKMETQVHHAHFDIEKYWHVVDRQWTLKPNLLGVVHEESKNS